MAKETNKKEMAQPTDEQKVLPFGKMNYLFVIIGLVLIAVGFILMIGGGSTDPDVFNEEMFNFRRITLAPILVLAGFVVEIVAIFWKGKK
jgi:hypothetical protein